MADTANPHAATAAEPTRRDFLTLTATAVGVIGAGAAVWPFIGSMNPAKDTLALSTTDFDLAPVQEGQSVKTVWRGKTVFVRHRTAQEIEEARAVEVSSLPDPQTDRDRVKKPEWLIVIGICTHLGCVPVGTASGENRGPYKGWFCPCHGSAYDTSGRIRQGPAPANLEVPPYQFTSDTTIRIG